MVVTTGDGAADLADLDPVVAAAAYAVLSEAARNAQRHSGAGGCRLTVLRDGETLEVRCEDDGRGPAGAVGVGTRSILERADELGGWAEVTDASPGTRVRAVLPVVPGAPVARPDDAAVAR